MLTVRDLANLPDLQLAVVAGVDGLGNEVTWLHVSELADPTKWLEGGELLLTTGLGVGESATAQRTYVRRLAKHRVAGLGFGLGFGFSAVPDPIVEAAEKVSFPVLAVPYEVPFVAITKTAFTLLANEQLEQQTRALAVHERLSDAVIQGRGVDALLGVLSGHLACSLALVDEDGRVVNERHHRRRASLEGALELPVIADGEVATLRAAREGKPFGEYDRLVLHHGQTALAFELSRRRAVSAAELRLAGDLLEDLEGERLDERETGRRMSAFGLEPAGSYAALLAAPRNGQSAEQIRREVAEELDRRRVRYLSTARHGCATFLVEAATERDILVLAEGIVQAGPKARVGVGRPANGPALGRSLLEARAALDAGRGDVASYRDLGSLELLLSLPDAALEAFVDRVLGSAADSERLMGSLAALLDSGCRWSDAAETLGVHRHTLRYRMERLREQTGRHPDDPAERMELWLAVKARQALAARNAASPRPT
jgi:purine catabolism regulator